MKNTVYGQLFGNPQIYLNGKPIFFAFSKINGLLYYLFVNKTVSRDEIANLLWPNMSEKNAKKNLRNTIYQANKLLGNEYIQSPNKLILVLNDELTIISDVELFKEDSLKYVTVYKDYFLKGFFLKGSEEFELWVVKMRQFFEKEFVNGCYKKIKIDINQGNYLNIEKNVERLIDIDNYDERHYELLMVYYQKIHRHEKVLKVYYTLADILNNELGTKPSSYIRQLFETSLMIINNQLKKKENRFKDTFFGRLDEIKKLESNLNSFYYQERYDSILIVGEEGVGKKSLLNRVLDNNQQRFYILETQCYEIEQQFNLRAWKKILLELGELINQYNFFDHDYWNTIMRQFFPDMTSFGENDNRVIWSENNIDINVLSQIIVDTLTKYAESNKIIVIFQNIQWLDHLSCQLLMSVMFHLKKKVMFILTLRNDTFISNTNLVSMLRQNNLVTELNLKTLSKIEMTAFITQTNHDRQLKPSEIDQLFFLTEGNFLFLKEYLNLIRSDADLDVMNIKMTDILENRFTHLTTIENSLCEKISYFYNSVAISLLSELMDIPIDKLVQVIDPLIKQSILVEEVIASEVSISFVHNRFSEYFYKKQRNGKRIKTHGLIAKCLEKNNISDKNDCFILSMIASHFREAKMGLKAIDYKLKYLQSYFNFYTDLFPANPIYEQDVIINKDLPAEEFIEIRLQLNELQGTYKSEEEEREYDLLTIRLAVLEGRFFIRNGKYDEALNCLNYVIKTSNEWNKKEFLLEAYKQLIYYNIQIDNVSEMYKYIELALAEATANNNHELIGILMRLKGLYYLMTGKFVLAENCLNDSISLFTLTTAITRKYTLNIAAAYDYLAEIKNIQKKYDQAITLQQKAIDLCDGKVAYSSISVFYINMGIILFAKEDYEEASNYFNKAYDIYETCSSIWKRTQLDVYMALIKVYERDYDAVEVYLISSQKYADRFLYEENGILNFAKAIIKHYLIVDNQKDLTLGGTLEKDECFYYEKALKNLNNNRNRLEIDLLKKLI